MIFPPIFQKRTPKYCIQTATSIYNFNGTTTFTVNAIGSVTNGVWTVTMEYTYSRTGTGGTYTGQIRYGTQVLRETLSNGTYVVPAGYLGGQTATFNICVFGNNTPQNGQTMALSRVCS